MTNDIFLEYLYAILNSRVYEVAHKTALEKMQILSDRLEHNILLKREDTQPIFCYKIRGAYNKMASLSETDLARGVVVASAGNHAQGVALSAKKLGCKALAVMPTTTPAVKVDAVKRLGGKVMLVGDVYDEAFAYAQKVCQEEKSTFINAFDDPAIIAGQGTVGMEILNQNPGPLDAVFVPIGGGGLVSGVAAYIKQVRPEVKVIGVEPYESDAMYQSLKAKKRIKLKKVGIFADGVAVKQVGKENFKICAQYLDDIVHVTTDETCAALKDICEDTRTIMEPSGALAVAGIKKWLKKNESPKQQQKTVVGIASGANINFDRLRHISERAEIGEKREAIIAVTIPEARGSFRKFYRTLGKRSISEFNYRYSNNEQAHIFVGVQIREISDVKVLIDKFAQKGIASMDLTDNEVAKIHARYMVGGRVPELKNERLFSFEFPERPGALGDFLDQIGSTWNITLFHYRNHGSDFGRVLCGIQVPPESQKAFSGFLKTLGYVYKEESDNPVYQLFLR